MTRPIAFNSFKFRLLFEIIMGLLFYAVLVYTLSLRANSDPNPTAFIYTIFLFVFISEGIFLFNKIISKKYPWHVKTNKRILMLLGFIVVWGYFIHVLSRTIQPFLMTVGHLSKHDFVVSFALVILFISIFVILLIAFNYHESLNYFVIENERLKQEKLKQDYFALQDQINPHFLFNNLSTLIAIIQSDPQLAVRFAESFSDVYRYVLQSKEVYSVPLKDEVVFIKACLSLHQERLGDGLHVGIDIPDTFNGAHIPPLSLQILVENAIKHNCATLSRPMNISIYAKENRIFVTNNLNPRNSSYSTNTGLDNLRKRYALLTNESPVMIKTNDEFIVELPLIKDTHACASNCG